MEWINRNGLNSERTNGDGNFYLRLEPQNKS
jgi:hypothetical protein